MEFLGADVNIAVASEAPHPHVGETTLFKASLNCSAALINFGPGILTCIQGALLVLATCQPVALSLRHAAFRDGNS
jgi:hypothetical protein